MYERFVYSFVSPALLLLPLLLVGACSKDESVAPEPTASAPDPSHSDSGSPAELEAKLAAADLLDGKADKIVTRCASCALGMDGVVDNALEAHGYTLYFCQAGCAERFGEDMDASILAMKIPEN